MLQMSRTPEEENRACGDDDDRQPGKEQLGRKTTGGKGEQTDKDEDEAGRRAVASACGSAGRGAASRNRRPAG